MTPTRHQPSGNDGSTVEPVGYNTDVETALIGALMMHGPEALAAADGLQPDDFSPSNAHIWAAATTIAARGHYPDLGLITNEVGTHLLETLGGHQGLNLTLLDAIRYAPVVSGVPERADIIRRIAKARRIQATALQLAGQAHNGHADALLDRLNQLRTPATRRLTLTPATNIDLARPLWIWDQRIPVGGVTLLAGQEGHGKTLLVCWLAARITQGQLSGERHNRPADVIYVGLEDDRSTVIKPRLIAAGVDPDRFHFVDLADSVFALDTHLDDLADAANGLDVGLIVFDPLDAHLGHTIDSHKKGEVQAAIGRLASLTQNLRCGALGLAHFNKASLGDLITRINGSRAFATAVRSVLAVGPHPDAENDRLCVLAKANMTSKTDVGAVRFRIEGTTIPSPDTDDDEPIATASVAILGEEHGHNPDQLLNPPSPEQRTATDEAADWLHSLLAQKPQPLTDIKRLAKAEGITDKTLRLARERLNLVTETRPTTGEGRGRHTQWRLPSSSADS